MYHKYWHSSYNLSNICLASPCICTWNRKLSPAVKFYRRTFMSGVKISITAINMVCYDPSSSDLKSPMFVCHKSTTGLNETSLIVLRSKQATIIRRSSEMLLFRWIQSCVLVAPATGSFITVTLAADKQCGPLSATDSVFQYLVCNSIIECISMIRNVNRFVLVPYPHSGTKGRFAQEKSRDSLAESTVRN